MRLSWRIAALAFAGWAASLPGLRAAERTMEFRQPQIDPSPAFLKLSPAQLSTALLVETNRVRREHGCSSLRQLSALNAAADDQAAISAIRVEMSHTSPVYGQATPTDRVRRRGVEPVLCAENVAALSLGGGEEVLDAEEIAARLVRAWMESPGHRRNLLNPDVTHFGSAVRFGRGPYLFWCAYSVQVFVRR